MKSHVSDKGSYRPSCYMNMTRKWQIIDQFATMSRIDKEIKQTTAFYNYSKVTRSLFRSEKFPGLQFEIRYTKESEFCVHYNQCVSPTFL